MFRARTLQWVNVKQSTKNVFAKIIDNEDKVQLQALLFTLGRSIRCICLRMVAKKLTWCLARPFL